MVVKADKQRKVPLKAFTDIVDISKVHTYSLDESGKGLIITFYDKEGKKIIPKYSVIINQQQAIDKMQNQDISIPWQVNRFLDLDGKLSVSEDHTTLSKDGDYGTLENMRNAVEWLANQFVGKVKWENQNG